MSGLDAVSLVKRYATAQAVEIRCMGYEKALCTASDYPRLQDCSAQSLGEVVRSPTVTSRRGQKESGYLAATERQSLLFWEL